MVAEVDGNGVALLIDGTAIGTYSPSFYRQDGEVMVEVNQNMPPYSKPYYTIPRETKSVSLLDPYLYSYKADKQDSILITSVIAPITLWGEFLGVVGIDFSLEYLQKSVSVYQSHPEEQIFLIAEDGNFIYNPDFSLVGTHQTFVPDSTRAMLSDTMVVKYGLNRKASIRVMRLIPLLNTHWDLITTLPVKVAYESASKSFFNVLLLILVGFVILSIVISMVARNISEAIVSINNKLAALSLGVIDKSDRGRMRAETR